MKQKFAYAIDSTTSDACEVSHSLRAEANKTWLCPGCLTARQDSEIPSLMLKGRINDLVLNSIDGTGIGVIREDFLQLLNSFNAGSYIRLIRLLDQAGNAIPSFYGFLPTRYTVVRGDARSSYRKCDVCGRLLYFPMGKRYLLKSQFPDEELLVGEQFDGLITRSEIAERVKRMKWKEIVITELPLLDDPLDNLDLDTLSANSE
jgi:hypothetical protein